MKRALLSTAALALLIAAALRTRSEAGQAAVSFSRPGHEDLTFWVNHNGLREIDIEGEVGFGDMGRILMRRRANAPALQVLRDRFVFHDRDFAKLTPAAGVIVVDGGKIGAGSTDAAELRIVAGAGRIANVPVVVRGGVRGQDSGRADPAASADAGGQGARGFIAKIVEPKPGVFRREISVAGARIPVTVDARPLAKLEIRLTEPARVYLTAADGLAYAPAGAIHRYAPLPAEPFFHAEGSFEMELPAGRTVIEATRGPEYGLVRREVDLQPGRRNAVTLAPRRWIDMAARGFYSADAHIHANYTAEHHQIVTPADVRLMAQAEDLNNANMMVANSSGAFLHDTAFFEGKPSALSTARHVLYWNEEMRNAGLYGHMCLFGLRKLVEPLYTGFRGTPRWEDYPPNFTQAKAARAQGGAVTYAHPGYAPAFDGFSARELPVDAALGEVDALDVLSNNPEEPAMENWYRLLNCGLRLGVSAGTDAFTNVADHYIAGGGRVYVHTGGAMDYARWIEGFRRGRSFATNGPMLWLRVDGKAPGGELRLPAGQQTVRVSVRLDTEVPAGPVELVVNGRVLSPAPRTVTLDRSSWIAARARGPRHRLVLNDTAAFAHTSPVYVYLGNQPIASEEDARFWMGWIDQLIARTRERGQFASEAKREEVIRLFASARDVYARKAAEAGGAATPQRRGMLQP